MRSPVIALCLAITTTVAVAQPGQAPAPYPPPAPAPYPPAPPAQCPYGCPPPAQPAPYVPPPYMYQPPAQVQLTAEEARLLARGEITSGQHLGGVALNWFVGFGLGHAVQGRWAERGWIFTVGESASLLAMFIGIGQMADNTYCDAGDCYDTDGDGEDGAGLAVMGLLGYMVFHVWGIVDAAVGPSTHNQKVRALRARTGYNQGYFYGGVTPYIAPANKGDGGTAGVTFRF